MLLPNNQSKEGTLKHCSLQYNVALVSVKNCRYVRHVNLEQCSINYSSKVVAVGRSFESGALMATRGARTCWSGPFDCKHLSYSTCKISKVLFVDFLSAHLHVTWMSTLALFAKLMISMSWLVWNWRPPCWYRREVSWYELLWQENGNPIPLFWWSPWNPAIFQDKAVCILDFFFGI